MTVLLTLAIRCKFFRDSKRWLFKVIHLRRQYRQYVCYIGLLYIPERISNITLCFWCQYAFSLHVRRLSEKSKKKMSTLLNQTYMYYIFRYVKKHFPPSNCIDFPHPIEQPCRLKGEKLKSHYPVQLYFTIQSRIQ